MGAMVFGCGHAAQLMEVCSLDGAPQIHMHFLTDPEEVLRCGFGKVELVCHGCGDSLLLYYTDTSNPTKHMKVRNSFVKKHRDCPDFGDGHHCCNFRSNFSVIDLRAKPRVRKAKAQTRSIQDSTP